MGKLNSLTKFLTLLIETIVIPKDAADKNNRIIFETSKDRVERFRSGKLPEVEQVEGCS